MGLVSKGVDRLALRWRLRKYQAGSGGSNAIAAAGASPGPEASRTWAAFAAEIDHYARRYDPCTFLTWPPIRKAMVASGAMVDAEFAEMSGAARWTELAVLLRETTVGMPEPYRHLPASSSNQIHQLYHLYRFEQSLGPLGRPARVFEFGGGYGAMCRLLSTAAGFDGYAIFDLPLLSAIQSYYIAHALPAEVAGRVTLLTAPADVDAAAPVDLFISTWALSEVPLPVRAPFEPMIARAACVLLAYQSTIDGLDNERYFADLAARTPHRWEVHEIAHKRGNFYMFGRLPDARQTRSSEPSHA